MFPLVQTQFFDFLGSINNSFLPLSCFCTLLHSDRRVVASHSCPVSSNAGERKLPRKGHTAQSIHAVGTVFHLFLKSSYDTVITGDNDSLFKEPRVFLNKKETLPTDSTFNQYITFLSRDMAARDSGS